MLEAPSSFRGDLRCFAMETEDDDADNIFDLGEDDEDAGNPAEVPVVEVEEGDGDEVMENDPYNPDDWDDALGVAEAEEETRWPINMYATSVRSTAHVSSRPLRHSAGTTAFFALTAIVYSTSLFLGSRAT